jgi:hypothetical protein
VLLRNVTDPVACWQYAERYLGVGTRTYSSFAGDLDIDPAYHPQLGRRSFTLPSFAVPDTAGEYRTNAVPSPLHPLYRRGESFVLPVHPDALSAVGPVEYPPGPVLEVVPSANARTVFVERIDGVPVPPHFVKLHYPKRLSRFTRKLRRPVIELQLWVADELVRAGLPVLPEVGGGYVEPGGWGFLVRSATFSGSGAAGPPGGRYTVPLFALYGHDYHAPGDPTLLEQLVMAAGEPPARYVAERIVEPMVRLWVRGVRRTGCPLETHGQNTLFSFSPDGTETRIGYRDSAVYVDAPLRASLGLTRALPPANVIPRDVPMAPEEVFSLTYDSFMGHHALDYVAALAAARFGVSEHRLHEAARAAFADESGGRIALPATTFYYDDTLHDDGDWKLVDTGVAPTWR